MGSPMLSGSFQCLVGMMAIVPVSKRGLLFHIAVASEFNLDLKVGFKVFSTLFCFLQNKLLAIPNVNSESSFVLILS